MQQSNIKNIGYGIAIIGLLLFVVSVSSASAFGNKIFYQTVTSDGYGGIYTMNIDGSNQSLLWNPSFIIGEPDYSPDGNYIIYRQAGVGGNQYLYRKNSYDNTNGIQINTKLSNSPSYSIDGNYIVYCEQGAGGMWLKNANDTGNGTKVLNTICGEAKMSLGNSYIYYENQDDNYKIYAKNSTDTGTGYAITSVGATGAKFALSNDGNSIVYTNANDRFCWKKDLSIAGDGIPITSQSCYYPSFSTDGNSIVYSNSFHVWKKNANDTGNGTQLVSYTSYYPGYNGIISIVNGTCGTAAGSYDYTATTESGTLCAAGTASGYSWPSVGNTSVYTCQGSGDGNDTTCSIIHNQDPCKNGVKDTGEVGIDFGGTCAGGVFTYSGALCENKTFTQLSGYSSINFFNSGTFSGGTLTPIQYGGTGSYVGYTYTSADYLSQDELQYNYAKTDSSISTSTLSSFSGAASYFHVATGSYITAYSIRNHVEQKIEYVKIKMTAASGATVGYVDFIEGGKVQGTGWLQGYGTYAMAIAPSGKSGISIKIWGTKSFDFSGFDMGSLIYSTITKAQCGNDNVLECTIGQIDANNFTCTPSSLGQGVAVGSTCGFVNGYCMPTNIVYTPVYNSGTVWTNSGAFAGGGGLDNNFMLIFNKMQGVGSGSCAAVFSGTTFLYGDRKTSIIRSNILSNWKLAETKWTCNAEYINVDICEGTYDIVETFVQSLITTFTFFVDGSTGPIVKTFGYLFEPIKGQTYCAFGDAYTWNGKTDTYYSWSSHGNVDVSGQTKFDYIVIIIVVIFTFIIVFK